VSDQIELELREGFERNQLRQNGRQSVETVSRDYHDEITFAGQRSGLHPQRGELAAAGT